jgi:hypothetical protein
VLSDSFGKEDSLRNHVFAQFVFPPEREISTEECTT